MGGKHDLTYIKIILADGV